MARPPGGYLWRPDPRRPAAPPLRAARASCQVPDATLPTFSSAEAFTRPCRLLVLASGGGSNAARLLAHFAEQPTVARVVGLLSNNPAAGAPTYAAAAGVPTATFDRVAWRDGSVQALIARDFAKFLGSAEAAILFKKAGLEPLVRH